MASKKKPQPKKTAKQQPVKFNKIKDESDPSHNNETADYRRTHRHPKAPSSFINPPSPRKTLWERTGPKAQEVEQRSDPTTMTATDSKTSSSSTSATSENPIVKEPATSSQASTSLEKTASVRANTATSPSTNRPTSSATSAAASILPTPVQPKTSKISSLLKSELDKALDKMNAPTPPHLIIEARAGTGKTTTLVKALERMRGIVDPAFVPSPQQQAIFDQVELSRGAGSVCFVAFNKSIATELQRRVPPGCDAMTMHSMGLKAVTKNLGRFEINQYVVQDIIADLLHADARQLKRVNPILVNATEDLVGLCKMNLVNPTGWNGKRIPAMGEPVEQLWAEALDDLVNHYDVDLGKFRSQVFDLVPQVLERCRDPRGKIGFDDMIWLPIVLDLPVFRYDVLLVDEAQDLNRCQQTLAKRVGRRLILCGDPKQAIYGFAGADAESMSRMECELRGDDIKSGRFRAEAAGFLPGCVKLPLTVTRRCGHAIVREANAIVPDFQAHETNCEGKVSDASFPRKAENDRAEVPWEKSYGPTVQDGDMCLCRVNAPLVGQCFRFIKAGRKANIQGRDVAKGLTSTINKMKADSVIDLVRKLSAWHIAESAKEQAKRNPNEQRLISIQDRFDCLLCFTDGTSTVEGVLAKIEAIFTNNKDAPGVRFSSIHKAKGLEARRVFLLEPKGATVPHPMAKSKWQVEQEYNLRYVAITRAIEEIVFVS